MCYYVYYNLLATSKPVIISYQLVSKYVRTPKRRMKISDRINRNDIDWGGGGVL